MLNTQTTQNIEFILSPESEELDEGDIDRLNRSASSLFEKKSRSGRYQVGLLICNDEKMVEYHRDYSDDPTTTDVLAFEDDSEDYLGDIIVCREVAEREAQARGHAAEAELLFYALHGFLHLLGMEDDTPEKREQMLALQRQALAEIDIEVRS